MSRLLSPVRLGLGLALLAAGISGARVARADPAADLAEIRTLRAQGGHAATSRLCELIRSRSEEVRVAALQAVASVGVRSDRTCEAVRRALDEESSPEQQEAALQALGRIGGAADVAVLIETLRGRDEVLRGVAHGALRTLTGRTTPQDYRQWYQWWRREGKTFQSVVRRALAQLPDAEGQERERLRGLLARDGWAEIALVEDAAREWLRAGDRTLRTHAFYLAAALRLGEVVSEIESALPHLSTVEGEDGLRAVRALGLSADLLAPFWRRRLEGGT